MNAPLLEICLKDLFADYDVLTSKYQENTVNAILRVRDMYNWLVKFPFKRDSEFVKEECDRYRISRPTAYADLNLIKALMPDLSKTSKEFARWRFSEMILQTFDIAKAKKDIRTMERAAASYAKFMNIDKEEEQSLDLSQIIPPPLIPSEDPSSLGFKPMQNRREVIQKLIQKYSRDIPDILDITEETVEVDAFLKGYPQEDVNKSDVNKSDVDDPDVDDSNNPED